jgi:hypothetical protein
MTFVGPARVGAIKSIIEYLSEYPAIGITSCSMSIIDDVAFIHLHLTTDARPLADLTVMNEELDRITISPLDPARLHRTGPVRLLPQLLPKLLRAAVADPSAEAVANLSRKVGDFHLLAGPARRISAQQSMDRRALWVLWEVEGRQAELSVPLIALHKVLHDLVPTWIGPDGEPDEPNVEYLICRRVRNSVLRGKGKISFPPRLNEFITSDVQAGLTALSERVEEAWRAELHPRNRVRELTVSWREKWLGHWTSPLD